MKIYTVKSAAKDYPEEGIKKGEPYFYCTPKCRRKTKDQREKSKSKPALEAWIQSYAKSHQGEFSSNIDRWREEYESLQCEEDRDQLEAEVQDYLDEKEERKNNIPEQLQESHIINDQIDELETLLEDIRCWNEEED